MRPSYAETIPKYDLVRKYNEYWQFVQWSALPADMRDPKTQKELAKLLSIHELTLTRWSRMPEFYQDMRALVKKHLQGDLAGVFRDLRDKIRKAGSAAEVKVWLQWVDDFVEKTETKVESETILGLTPETEAIIKEFHDKIKQSLIKKL